MEDDRRSRFEYSDPPAVALSPAVLDALTALLTPRREVQEARVSQMTKTFDGVEVARHLVLGLWLFEPPEDSGEPRVRTLMTDLMRPLGEQTGITSVHVPSAIARKAFESHGVVVFLRE